MSSSSSSVPATNRTSCAAGTGDSACPPWFPIKHLLMIRFYSVSLSLNCVLNAVARTRRYDAAVTYAALSGYHCRRRHRARWSTATDRSGAWSPDGCYRSISSRRSRTPGKWTPLAWSPVRGVIPRVISCDPPSRVSNRHRVVDPVGGCGTVTVVGAVELSGRL